jgi:hypothetical protein
LSAESLLNVTRIAGWVSYDRMRMSGATDGIAIGAPGVSSTISDAQNRSRLRSVAPPTGRSRSVASRITFL